MEKSDTIGIRQFYYCHRAYGQMEIKGLCLRNNLRKHIKSVLNQYRDIYKLVIRLICRRCLLEYNVHFWTNNIKPNRIKCIISR